MYKPMPYLCMGISRFFGGIGFLIGSIGTFNYLNGKWELGIRQMIDISSVGVKGYLALGLAIFAGLILLIFGQILGASIPIKNDDWANRITILWHHIANMSIVWIPASCFAVFVALGRETSEFFFRQESNDFIIIALIIAVFGGTLTFGVMGKAGKMIMRGNPAGRPYSRIGPIAVGLMMGYAQLSFFNLPVLAGLVVGLILPYIVIPITSVMWRKDMIRRDPKYIDL